MQEIRVICALAYGVDFPRSIRVPPIAIIHQKSKAWKEVPPYIDIIDVPDHAPLRPWIFPASPINSSTINAGELEPETHQEPASSLASSQPGEGPRVRKIFFE